MVNQINVGKMWVLPSITKSELIVINGDLYSDSCGYNNVIFTTHDWEW